MKRKIKRIIPCLFIATVVVMVVALNTTDLTLAEFAMWLTGR